MTLAEKVGRMLHVGFDGLTAPDTILDWLQRGQVGGIILFQRNVDTSEQLAGLVQQLRDAASRPILISIDQEGGAVARLRQQFTESPGAMALGAADSTELAEQVAGVLGTELRALGINWVLAPVVDIAHNADNAVIGTRSPGRHTDRVRDLALAQIRGFQQAGVAATAKHFPGHGNTPTDSHVALPVVSGSVDYLWKHDLVPFRAAVEHDVDAVLVSHVKFEALDAEHPASLSRRSVTDLLRGEIGFRGLVCTDCMEMNAITKHYGAAESGVLAALAGHDVIFFSHTHDYQQAVFDALLAAAESGRLSTERIESANQHIAAMIERYPVEPRPALTTIRSPEHLAIMRQAAEASIVVQNADSGIFPLRRDTDQRIALVEFAPYLDTAATDSGRLSSLAGLVEATAPEVTICSLPVGEWSEGLRESARTLARTADVLVLATRNAHLWEQELEFARELLQLAHQTILVCLKNPYDADVLPSADTIVFTLGASEPSLQAAVAALFGEFQPTGKLPV